MEGTKIQEATHETFCIFNRLKGLTTARHNGWNQTHKTHLYEVLEHWWQKETDRKQRDHMCGNRNQHGFSILNSNIGLMKVTENYF